MHGPLFDGRVRIFFGDMVELVDTLASGASGSNTVRVRVSLSPQCICRSACIEKSAKQSTRAYVIFFTLHDVMLNWNTG